MNKFFKYCNWELKNEFLACAYFTVMLLVYCIIDLIIGDKNVDIYIIFEMFLTNYALSTLQKIFLDQQKEYNEKDFVFRASLISLISVIVTVTVSVLGGWFDGMPFWAGILIYTILISSYLTVWIILKVEKKYDTQKLNEQLANYKNSHKKEG